MNAVARYWRAALSGLALCVPLITSATSAASEPVDAELVIAVGTSTSMKTVELQRQGYAAAFRSREVIDAIADGVHDRVAVAYVEWGASGSVNPRIRKISSGGVDCTIGEALWRGWNQDDDETQ
jgi:hypothetical protein